MKKSELYSIFKEFLAEQLQPMVHAAVLHELRAIQSYTPNATKSAVTETHKPKKIFKGADLISELLNETVNEQQAAAVESDTTEWPTFDRRLFLPKHKLDNEKKSEPATSPLTDAELKKKQDIRDAYRSAISAQEMIPDDRRGVAIPAEIADALTKDYSKLVKTFRKTK